MKNICPYLTNERKTNCKKYKLCQEIINTRNYLDRKGYLRFDEDKTFARRNDLVHRTIAYHYLWHNPQRSFKGQDVHHINENKKDNCPQNLKILTKTQHILYHEGKIGIIIYLIKKIFQRKEE